jgi:hypothetical protein
MNRHRNPRSPDSVVTNRLAFKEIAQIRTGLNRYCNRAFDLSLDLNDFEDDDASRPIEVWRNGMLRLLTDFEQKLRA